MLNNLHRARSLIAGNVTSRISQPGLVRRVSTVGQVVWPSQQSQSQSQSQSGQPRLACIPVCLSAQLANWSPAGRFSSPVDLISTSRRRVVAVVVVVSNVVVRFECILKLHEAACLAQSNGELPVGRGHGKNSSRCVLYIAYILSGVKSCLQVA